MQTGLINTGIHTYIFPGIHIVYADDFQWHHEVSARSSLDISLADPPGLWDFEACQRIQVWQDGELIFSGFLDTVEVTLVSPAFSPRKKHRLSCKSNEYLADKRRMSGGWLSTTAGAIVQELIEDYLEAEGVTIGRIDPGSAVVQYSSDFLRISEIFDEMAKQSMYVWYITEDLLFYFVALDAFEAPWELTPDDVQTDNISLKRGNPDYKNRLLLRGGSQTTSTQEEHKIGDGKNRTWAVRWPIADTPRVWVNNVEKTVELQGTEGVTAAFYWSKGSENFSQDSSETVLTSAADLKIQYVGTAPLNALTQDAQAIAERAALENMGTGIVDEVLETPLLVTSEAMITQGNNELELYATKGAELTFQTLRHGLAAGHMLTVQIPQLNLTDEKFLVSQIEGSLTGILNDPGMAVRYDVTACQGPISPSWTTLRARAQKGPATLQKIGEGAAEATVLVFTEPISKVWTAAMHPNPFVDICPSSQTTPETPSWPCFAEIDKWPYLVLYELVRGVYTEFFRCRTFAYESKKITYNGTLHDGVWVQAYVKSSEANDNTIAAVGLWGGIECTDEAGTGYELVKVIQSITKNRLLNLQIEINNIKGW